MEDIVISLFVAAIVIGVAYAIPTVRQKYMYAVLIISISEVVVVASGVFCLIPFAITEYFYFKKEAY